VSAVDRMTIAERAQIYEEVTGALGERTIEILDRRRKTATIRRRGWLVRRLLLGADVVGLLAAFAAAQLLDGIRDEAGHVNLLGEGILFLAALPVWILAAKLYGLYDHDEERTNHTTVDDLVGVFHMVTVGTWIFFAGAWVMGVAQPQVNKIFDFWIFAVGLVTLGRAAARAFSRTTVTYQQNAVIVGAGDVGQLVARKVLQHPEYGINLLGFVDAEPKERRDDLGDLTVLGEPDRLPAIIRLFDVERVIVAFSGDAHTKLLELIRTLRGLDVQVDVVPRLFEIVGPRVGIHNVEGLPLLGLPPARVSRTSLAIKRVIDMVGALLGLVLTSPFLAYAAWRIKRESPGPVFFRQTRLGMQAREFTALKFRTMKVDTDDTAHREFIRRTMSPDALPESNGIYKLDREDAVTPFGRWLRKTGLDELPQLINVLIGQMSLVGPRPCLPYETEFFAPYHHERFLVPPGITGYWQVTARAHATFGEALDMDVAYVRSWSVLLDLTLMLRTPFQLIRRTHSA
jgi:exopolysaccharide biosynthesis polyprenyl glycosylphosphotransferase